MRSKLGEKRSGVEQQRVDDLSGVAADELVSRRSSRKHQQDGELVNRSESQMSRIEREGTQSAALALRLSELTGLPVESFVKKDPREGRREPAGAAKVA